MTGEWRIWQLVDSAFPSGAFVQSGGLEAAVQHGFVNDAESLAVFVRAGIRQIQHGVLIHVEQAWTNPESLPKIDADCELFLNNHVANRASRSQGKALLSIATRAFTEISIDPKILPHSHLAPIFGVVCRCLDIDRARACSLFLFMTARGYFSSAVRLGIVGPIECQRLQASLIGEIEPISSANGPVQTSPLLDLIQGTQDRLYSRLFQS